MHDGGVGSLLARRSRGEPPSAVAGLPVPSIFQITLLHGSHETLPRRHARLGLLIMTLILTVANSRGVHQSSDYQLTDPNTGAPVSDRAGSKQLEAAFDRLHMQMRLLG